MVTLAVSFERAFKLGMAYVALSRSRTLNGLYITGFDGEKIKGDANVLSEMKRLFTEACVSKPFRILDMTNSISLTFLNARSASLHFLDIRSHPLRQHVDTLCIIESHIFDAKNSAYQMDNRNVYVLRENVMD